MQVRKPYNIIPPQDAYKIDIEYVCPEDGNCPPHIMDYSIKDAGAYTFYLNGKIQFPYVDFGFAAGTNIEVYIYDNKLSVDIKR